MFKTFRSPSLLIITALWLLLLIPLASFFTPSLAHPSTPANSTMVARMWHGRTQAEKADTYADYLYESGIKKIRAIPDNLGVQTLRRVEDGVAEFYVISYWKSRDAIRQFAGDDIEKTRHLPRDPEFLLELEPRVKHFDVLVDEWGNSPQRMAIEKLKSQPAMIH